MAALEEVLGRLLVPDNATIQQATRELQAVYRDPAAIPALCDILLGSQNPQIRQYAAVLLRKRLVRVWTRLPEQLQQRIKTALLQCLMQEKVHLVVVSSAHLVSVIAKYEMSRGKWDELSVFIQQHCQSPDPMQREVGMLLLSSLMESAALQLQPQFPSLINLFSSALEDSSNKMVPFYGLKSLTAMVEYVGHEELPLFRALIPKIMVVIRALIAEDEDKACEAMELFDELVECEVAIVTPHLLSLIQFCLEVASNTTLGNNVRVKVLSFVSWLATLKKKALLKQGLLPSILRTMLTIMATPGEDEEDGERDAVQSHSPIALAAQVLDVLCLHLPPERVFTPVLEMIGPWVQNGNQLQRAASLIALAVMAEGCSDYIRNNHLSVLLDVAYKGINDKEQIVRNAALFAIGQFSEHLQPEISQYSDTLLPVLFQFLDLAISTHQKQQDSGITKIFYALESFCEQLGLSLVPYLQPLMDKLFLALTVAKNVHIRELAVSAIGAVANACQENLLPYFPRIIEILKEYISMPYSQDTSIALLQAQAVDTLGVLARTIGEENFKPLAQDCILLGLNLMQSMDPDLRRSIYGMFASVSCVLRDDLTGHLPSIIPRMVESLQSQDGVVVHYTAAQMSFLDFEEEEEEEGGGGGENSNESLEDSSIEGVSVENAYLEEKEDTCNALGEIAENVGVPFLAYMDDCFREVNILSDHSSDGIRKAAITTLGRLSKVWYQCVCDSGGEGKADLEVLINSTFLSMAATVRTDADRTVAIATLETLEDMLKSLKQLSFPLAEKPLESLVVSVQDVLEQKAECQGEEEDTSPVVGEELAEYDGVLVECAGSIVGPLAALVGGDGILPRLKPLLPLLLKKLQSPNASSAVRSFAIGTFAEIVEGLGASAVEVTDLYPVFIGALRDEEDEVCSNAVYGLGVLAGNAHHNMHSRYPEILQSLFMTVRSRNMGRIVDNVCAAVCRMIMARPDAVPLDQVLPVLVQSLPLKEDMDENATVYNCITQLFQAKNPVMMSNLHPMLKVFATELSPDSNLTKDLQLQLVRLLQVLNVECPQEMQTASSGLTQEQLTVLVQATRMT